MAPSIKGVTLQVSQQLGNGSKWADSFFGARAPLHLPTELFDGY